MNKRMYTTTLSRPKLEGAELAALEQSWRTLAAESDASYFQDWGWVGCMAPTRYRDPVLVEVHRDGCLVALALFNRRASRRDGASFYLHESTDPVLSSIFVEHNGPLISIADPVLRQAVLADLLTNAISGPIEAEPARTRRLVLSGVGPDCAGAALLTGGVIDETSVRVAPYADLRALLPDEPFIERLSRNTRHQLRRSNRQYAALGLLALRRAETVATGLAFLAEMIVFHDRTWKARGKPGAFATPAVRTFYETLIADGIPSGEVDLLQVTAGSLVIGYLMNFNHRNVISAYQSGFNYDAAGAHQKPGLTCHYLAIEHYRASGAAIYDFLAGADRYKLSLANAQRWLHWLSAAPAWHPYSVGARVKRLLQI